ncbi:NUDIX domain-containing protein [Saccharopolyspora erythraea]|nr:NUDIX domain-containing protein [Saccharopolyspora erythraea]
MISGVSGEHEEVATYDASGRVVGSAPRGRMRAEGLWHAAGEVLLLSPGRTEVYVHRRTETKDIYPGMHDCWAGGVVAAGEDPAATAVRELAEELGVTGVRPRFLFHTVHELGSVRFHAYLYEVLWGGPVVHQPEEVAEGWWMPVEELRERLSDPSWPLVPDGRQFAQEWFAGRAETR